MDVLRHKNFGYSAVYDKGLLRWDESGRFGAKSGQNLDESGGFRAKSGQIDKIWIFCQAILNSVI